MVKDNVVELSTIYVHSDSITTQSLSQMTHFFCLNGSLDPKGQNPGENTGITAVNKNMHTTQHLQMRWTKLSLVDINQRIAFEITLNSEKIPSHLCQNIDNFTLLEKVKFYQAIDINSKPVIQC